MPPASRWPTGWPSTSAPGSSRPRTSTASTASAARCRSRRRSSWRSSPPCPILVAPDDIASELAICVLSFILGAAGFAVGRRSGAGLVRSLAGGVLLLAVAGVVVAIKIVVDH